MPLPLKSGYKDLRHPPPIEATSSRSRTICPCRNRPTDLRRQSLPRGVASRGTVWRTGLTMAPQAQTCDAPERRRRFALFHHHHRIDGEWFADDVRCSAPQRVTNRRGELRWYSVSQRHVEAVLIEHVRIPPRLQQFTLSAR